jgi:hypothetical protein
MVRVRQELLEGPKRGARSPKMDFDVGLQIAEAPNDNQYSFE